MKDRNGNARGSCRLCETQKPVNELIPAELVGAGISRLIQKQYPDWSGKDFICINDLNRFRMAYVREALESDKGEISALESEVLESFKENEVLTSNIYTQFDAALTWKQRWADRLASVGGSWGFILGFLAAALCWIALNSWVAFWGAFDPYPFILLNLVLSCLAAIQAPIILMSHSRLEARDRLRSEQDYKINLKAELEIRHLHEKMDHLLKHQWTRLLGIQEMQMELLKELEEGRLKC